jgi:hypothetical protein
VQNSYYDTWLRGKCFGREDFKDIDLQFIRKETIEAIENRSKVNQFSEFSISMVQALCPVL